MISKSISLSPGETHIWDVDLSASAHEASRFQDVLSSEEGRRAARYHNSVDRERYIMAHGALRDLLGRYICQPPEEVQLAHTSSGKPFLTGDTGPLSLQFSLSHSANHALVAICAGKPIGVDIERLDSRTQVLAVAKRFFSAQEVEALCETAVDRQLERFFQIWVCKESYVKAKSEGIIERLPTFTVCVDKSLGVQLVEDVLDPAAPSAWQLQLLESPRQFTSAIAFPAGSGPVLQFEWKPVDRA